MKEPDRPGRAFDRQIGPGALIAVCGPSGAGKDSLLRRVRDLCDGATDVVFPRRVVTRPSSDAEEHDTAMLEEFDRILAAGGFAVSWDAHGLKYALPASIDSEIGAGRCVVCNVSRTIIPELRKRYARVVAVLVTAPCDILLARLEARARDTDGNLSLRFARSASIDRTIDADVTLENVGPLDEGARLLHSVIESQLVLIST